MAGKVQLTFELDWKKGQQDAERLFKAYGDMSDKVQAKVNGMKPEAFDDWIIGAQKLNAAISITRGETLGLEKQQKALQNRIEALVKSGLDPNSEGLMRLKEAYFTVTKALNENIQQKQKEKQAAADVIQAAKDEAAAIAAAQAKKEAALKRFHKVQKGMLEVERSEIHVREKAKADAMARETARYTTLANASDKFLKDKTSQEKKTLSEIERINKKNADAVIRATERKKAAVESLKGSVMRYARYLAMAGAAAVGAFGGSVLKAASDIENAEAAFRPILGSLARAGQLVAEINETAATTPFQFDDITTSIKQLLPAANGSIPGVISMFRMLGDVSSGNAQRLDSVTRAYTKSMLRGKVDMRSMNMIARAGVPIFTELAKSMGVTVAQLMQLSREGGISAADLTKAFKSMTSEGGMFFKGMEIASKTLSGRWSTLMDNTKLLRATIGNEFMPVAKDFVEWSITAVKNLRVLSEDSLALNDTMHILAGGITAATTAMGLLVLAIKGSAILAGVKVALAAIASTAGAAVIAVSALAGAFVYLNGNAKAMLSLGESYTTMTNGISIAFRDYANSIKMTYNSVTGWIDDIGNYVTTGLSGLQRALFEVLAKSPIESMANSYKKGLKTLDKADEARTAAHNKQLDARQKADKKAQAERFQILQDYRDEDARHAKILAAINSKGVLGKGDPNYKKETVSVGTSLEQLLRDQRTEADMAQEALSGLIDQYKKHFKKKADTYRKSGKEAVEIAKAEFEALKASGVHGGKGLIAAEMALQELITGAQTKGTKARVAAEKTEAQKRVAAAKAARSSLYEILFGSVDDTTQRDLAARTSTITGYYQERMRIARVEEGELLDFMKAELARVLAIEKLSFADREAARNAFIDVTKSQQEKLNKLMSETSEMDYLYKKLPPTAKEADAALEEMTQTGKRVIDEYNMTMGEYLRSTEFKMGQLGSFVSHTTTLLTSLTKITKDSFKDMLDSIARDIFKMMANRVITSFFASILGISGATVGGGNAGVTGLLSSAFASPGQFAMASSANGNVFTSPSATTIAEKGIPEAVLPLTRKNGVLGLAAPAGGGGNSGGINVTFIDQSTGKKDVDVQKSADGKNFKLIIKDVVGTQIRTGQYNRDMDMQGIVREKKY